MSQVTRGDAQALMPEEVFGEFASRLTEQSAIQQLARRAPDMNRLQTRIPVLSVLPVSYIKNAGQSHSDTTRKKLTKLEWENKYLDAEDIITIVPVPDNVADDVDRNIWDEALPYIVESMAQKFDQAVTMGIDAPNAWPDDLLTGAAAAGNTVTLGDAVGDIAAGSADLYDYILGEGGLYNKVEEDGFDPNGNIGAIRFKSQLRGLRDPQGQPIFKRTATDGRNMQEMTVYDIDGVPSFFPKNNAVDPDSGLLITGDWSKLIWALRKDVTVDIFRTGVIQDPTTGDILYNLLQDDMSAMRVVMRIAWQVPNPVNITNTDAGTRYPFAALLPDPTT